MEGIVGEVKLFASRLMVRGWLRCDGQELAIEQFNDLYALLENDYSNNTSARNTFKLPKIPPIKPEGGTELHYIICFAGSFPSRP
jgi:microcystin-dependent protein